jgi:integrase
VRTRSGERYKPSALRGYERALRTRLLPALGGLRLAALGRPLLQELVDGLVAEGLAASTVRNALLPLRAIYRRALARSELFSNPTLGLALPALGGGRERVVPAGEAAALLAALPAGERALWATALYAGLRRGELRALRWRDVDFEQGLLRVERSWDPMVGPVAPKSRAGRRRLPLAAPLQVELAARRPAAGDELVFGGADGRPFGQAAVERARRHWRRAGLAPLGLHDCRHSYAALMIAAGVNPKALQQYMGHSSISVTLDRYGHLLPGNERQAGTMLAAYLEREAAGG